MARTFLRLFLLLVLFVPAGLAQTPDWEIFAGYSLQRSAVRTYYKSTPTIYTFREQDINLDGWEMSFTENVNRWFGGTLQLTGHHKSPVVLGTKNQETLFSIMYGPRFAYRMGWGSAYLQLPIGAGHTSVKVSPGPHASEWSFAVAAGVGVDVNLARRLAVRALQLQYSPMNQIATKNHTFQASAGLVFRLGEAQ